jgi:hypothetical protein
MRFKILIVLIVAAFSAGAQADCTASFLPYDYTGVRLPRPLPSIKQDVNGKCGPASLAIALSYFGRLFPMNAFNCFEMADTATNCVFATGVQNGRYAMFAGMGHLGATCFTLNSGDSLAETARLFGLFSNAQDATANQIASWVARGEVVLVHWLMGPEREAHWSDVQHLGMVTTTLKDPWPTSPADNTMLTNDFLLRSSTGVAGYFHTVRVSDRPLYP